MTAVLIYGATGWTGRMVARLLGERGIAVKLVGRDSSELARLSAATPGSSAHGGVAVGDLPRLIDGVDVVVNCAGPSSDVGLAVIDAAIQGRAHYLDISGEESFVRRVYGSRDSAAISAGVIVGPAFAGKGAIGDWLAAVMADEARASVATLGPLDVAIAYAHTSEGFMRPSRGSALSAAGQRFLRLRDRRRAPVTREFDFPRPFGRGHAVRVPGAEDISVLRHVPAREASTYIAIDPGHAANEAWARVILSASPVMPAVATAMLSALGRAALGLRLAEPLQTNAPTFAAAVELRAFDRTWGSAAVAADAYSVTAEIIALGAEILLTAAPIRAGVLAPAQICTPKEVLARLQSRGALAVYRDTATRL